MTNGWTHSKRIVADVKAAERFYAALGFKTLAHVVGGEGEDVTHQEQIYMSQTADGTSHHLILCRFPAFPPPPRPSYPGEAWICLNVDDVETACQTAVAFGGAVFRPGQDRPKHGVRAAIISDVDGQFIEIVGPMKTG